MLRRTFFRNGALLALSGAVPTNLYQVLGRPLNIGDVQYTRRSLLPHFLLEDIVRLIHLSDLPEDFIAAMRINASHLHLGSACQLTKGTTLALLESLRPKWGSDLTLDEAQTTLALLAGSTICHAIDKFVPFDDYTSKGRGKLDTLTDEAIYYDTVVIKEMAIAESPNLTLSLSENISEVTPEQVWELINIIRQRNLIRMHTFRPEFGDIDGWLSNLLAYQDLIHLEDARYAHIYCKPASMPFKDHLIFYNPKDSLIKLARGLQMGQTEFSDSLDDAVDQAKTQSTYAILLSEGLKVVQLYNNLLQGKIKPEMVSG